MLIAVMRVIVGEKSNSVKQLFTFSTATFVSGEALSFVLEGTRSKAKAKTLCLLERNTRGDETRDAEKH
jgi:hypothetical protein